MKSQVNSQIGINNESLKNPKGLDMLKREFTERMRAIKSNNNNAIADQNDMNSSFLSSGGQELLDDGKLSVFVGNEIKN